MTPDGVPQTGVPLSEPEICGNAWSYVKECLDTGWVSYRGPFVDRFEEAFSAYLGVPASLSTSSGTSALHLALATLGVGPGDEVLVPSLTFIASANAVVYTGARPVFCDVDPKTWTMDPDDAAGKVTPHTKAIMPVHLYGVPADMDPLVALARRHGLKIVEDATESLGASYGAKPAGRLGDIGCFSFNGNKMLTCGGGGMLVSDHPEWVARARHLATQAKVPGPEYVHDATGFNYRLTNLQAALGLSQLEQLDRFVEKKRAIGRTYRDQLAADGLGFQASPPRSVSAEWLSSARIPGGPAARNHVLRSLQARGIEARPVFTPMHRQPPYAAGASVSAVADTIAGDALNLPSSTTLTELQIEAVIDGVRASLATLSR